MLHSHKAGGTHKIQGKKENFQKIEVAEAELSWISDSNMDQVPKRINNALPTMQLDNIFHLILPASKMPFFQKYSTSL